MFRRLFLRLRLLAHRYIRDFPPRSAWWVLIRPALPALLLTLAGFFGPDLYFQWQGKPIDPFGSIDHWTMAVLLAALVTLTSAKWLRRTVLAVLAFNQAVWFGALNFYGAVLKPEQVELGLLEPVEAKDGVFAHLDLIVPGLMAAGLALLVMLVAQEWLGRRLAIRSRTGTVLLTLFIGLYVGRLMTHVSQHLMYPNALTPSVLGTTHAVVVGVRQTYFQTAAAANDPPKVTYRFSKGEQHEGPVTVIVVMGESINGLHMGIYGYERDTSPRLKEFIAHMPAGFSLTHKLGFSSGTATLASAPMFLKIPYYPANLGRSPVNLLGIARDNGFQNYYFSAQFAQTLEVANGRAFVDRIETLDTQGGRIGEIRDDVLIENMESLPKDEARRMIFLHQRVNHTPYLENCDHLDAEINTLKTSSRTVEGVRINDFDNGMRCYDRSLARIFDYASKQPGAVYVFVTADHNEAMGELEGIWGHGSSHLYVTLVPMMLFTNRPDGAIAQAFSQLKFPTSFEMSALVARTLGTSVTVDGYDPKRFFANSTLPFAYAGFIDVTRNSDGSFTSVQKGRNGKTVREDVIRLPQAAYKYP